MKTQLGFRATHDCVQYARIKRASRSIVCLEENIHIYTNVKFGALAGGRAREYNEIHLKIDVVPEVDDRQNRFNQPAT